MDKYVINGGKPLNGEIHVSGMKNAAVPIILSSILVEGKVTIENVPDISDVRISLDILEAMGAQIKYLDKNTVEIDSTDINPELTPQELVGKMRASYYLIGAELARFGMATVDCPGGCDFGTRPIDQHIKGFDALGADVVTVNKKHIDATTDPDKCLVGTSIYMDIVSVGATINIMIAAVKAKGITIIENAAHEPHIVDTANFLNACGAQISGAGTGVIKIKGVDVLHGTTYAIIPDMIEAGTYMVLAAATGGKLKINNVIPKHLESISAKISEMGAVIEEEDEAVTVYLDKNTALSNVSVKTLPYPGFPTDMNPQMCVLLCLANGVSTLTEGVWESRFRYVEELKRMGASITVEKTTAEVTGVAALTPAKVRAVDLRAGAAMVIAALAADGKSEIDEIYHIERGYEDIIEKLRAVGADITKVSE